MCFIPTMSVKHNRHTQSPGSSLPNNTGRSSLSERGRGIRPILTPVRHEVLRRGLKNDAMVQPLRIVSQVENRLPEYNTRLIFKESISKRSCQNLNLYGFTSFIRSEPWMHLRPLTQKHSNVLG